MNWQTFVDIPVKWVQEQLKLLAKNLKVAILLLLVSFAGSYAAFSLFESKIDAKIADATNPVVEQLKETNKNLNDLKNILIQKNWKD